MSFRRELARVHAARALDALARVQRGEAASDGLDPRDAHQQLGYFKATVETLAHDIETLTKQAAQGDLA